jgi:hypothetical protein
MDLREILESYPRERSPLSEAHEKIFSEQYKINREGATSVDSAAQRLEQWMHRRVASVRGGPILELGAGTLNHLPYEQNAQVYDIVEPFSALYVGKPDFARVRNEYNSVQDVPDNQRYRRIISIAVLEHLTDLPADVARSALLMDDDGVFQAGIPSEGGLLWGLAWRFSTGLAYRLRTGLDYGVVMRHEHVNDAKEIIKIVGHFFEEVVLSRFPTPLHQLSFYTYLEARRSRRTEARAYLGGRKQ